MFTRISRGSARLVVLSGPPLHGKTAVSRAISMQTGIYAIDVDEVRELYWPKGPDTTKSTPPEIMESAYVRQMQIAEALIRGGEPVIISGTFSKKVFKEPLESFLRRSTLGNVVCRLTVNSMERIDERLRKREIEGHLSSIKTREKYEGALRLVEPWSADISVHDVVTDNGIDATVESIKQLIS